MLKLKLLHLPKHLLPKRQHLQQRKQHLQLKKQLPQQKKQLLQQKKHLQKHLQLNQQNKPVFSTALTGKAVFAHCLPFFSCSRQDAAQSLFP